MITFLVTSAAISAALGIGGTWIVAAIILGPFDATKLVIGLPLNLVRLVLLGFSARTIWGKDWTDMWREWREKRAKRRENEARLLPWRRRR